MRTTRIILLAAVAAALVATPAAAWEADTTHAGLTEGAALGSRVHARLRALHTRAEGWLTLLTVAPDRATALYQKLAKVEPASGVVPDRRGRQTALAWLVAGSVLEGIPGDRDRHHFYDPTTRKGLSGEGPGIFGRLRGEGSVPGGIAAPEWILAKDNDLGLARFWLELERSATATSRVARDEHLAMALLCAGAMLHVLQDVGAPAHARDDLAEHLLPLGAGPNDRGSRFERLAGFIYGRLGVPAPEPAPARARARDFFTTADATGLADRAATRWYSAGTLPGEVVVPADPVRGEVVKRVIAAQKLASPKPTGELRLRGPAGPDGYTLRAADGTCLANYRVEEEVLLKFSISDACAAEQLAVILPEVGGASMAFLEWLFRGGLSVTLAGGSVRVSLPPGEPLLGAGKLMVLFEDADGRREPLATVDVAAGAALPSFTAPASARRAVAVFRGVDGSGEELVAVGSTP